MKGKTTLLITGSTGFVGNNLNIFFSSLNYELVNISLRDEKWKSQINNKSDAIIHLAGKAHDTKNTSSSQSYFDINLGLTQKIFDYFLQSDAKKFIFFSSVKAVADRVEGAMLTEDDQPAPHTAYGQSKLQAEQYILRKNLPVGKTIYILRPSMIHGFGNKGNLNLLFQLVNKGLPWPLGAFQNQRSFCSIANACFVVQQLLERKDIPSGIYNVADDEALSTNELIGLIAQSQNRNPKIWNISKKFIEGVAFIGDKLHLPLNTERLQKLTSSYVVSNAKIKEAIGKPLPVSSREGLLKTFKSFNS